MSNAQDCENQINRNEKSNSKQTIKQNRKCDREREAESDFVESEKEKKSTNPDQKHDAEIQASTITEFTFDTPRRNVS